MNHFIVAGFDFGTSYSKVVVRDLLTNKAKVVLFGREQRSLYPSYVYVNSQYVGGPAFNSFGNRVGYLKLLASDACTGAEDYINLHGVSPIDRAHAGLLLVGYFVDVLANIFSFLINDEDWSDYDPKLDTTLVQLAVPSGMLSAGSGGIEDMMLSALRTAYFLIDCDGHDNNTAYTLEQLADSWHRANEGTSQIGARIRSLCHVYPEVAAGVQTVMRSRQTPDGKFFTMDVGAGTVDLNVFYYQSGRHGNVQRSLNYWSCLVAPLGCSCLTTLHSQAGEHERASRSLTTAELERSLERYINHLIDRAFQYQPPRIEGDAGFPWLRNTYAYVFGGGSKNPLYSSVLRHVLSSRDILIDDVRGLPPPPEDMAIPHDAGNFGRFAVAYGLSFHHANLDDVILPHELQTFRQAHPVEEMEDALADLSPCHCHSNPDCHFCHGSGFRRRL